MPLIKGPGASTPQNIGRNIVQEMAAGRPQKQAVAVAMNTAGKSKSKPQPPKQPPVPPQMPPQMKKRPPQF
jgi:hypothetical protein